MGCDIHLSIEYRDIWNPTFWQSFGADIYMPRDYHLFGLLAGVRGQEVPLFPIRGIPDDLSCEVDDKYYRPSSAGIRKVVDPDWHTPSWLTYEEWVSVLTQDIDDVLAQYKAVSDVMKRLEQHGFKTRVIFWFDN